MVKGYESLADPDTKVDVNTAMLAAGRLQTLIDTRAGQPDIVDMRVKVGRLIDAVRSMLPESLWPELVRRIEGDAPADPQHHQIEAFDATRWGVTTRGNSPKLMTTMTNCNQSHDASEQDDFCLPPCGVRIALGAKKTKGVLAVPHHPQRTPSTGVSFADSQSLTASWPIW